MRRHVWRGRRRHAGVHAAARGVVSVLSRSGPLESAVAKRRGPWSLRGSFTKSRRCPAKKRPDVTAFGLLLWALNGLWSASVQLVGRLHRPTGRPRFQRRGPVGLPSPSRSAAVGVAPGPRAKTLLGSAHPSAAAAAGDGGHRGRAGPGRALRRRSVSGAPPPFGRRRGQAQAPVVQGCADADPTRASDPRHAGNTITRVRLRDSSTRSMRAGAI